MCIETIIIKDKNYRCVYCGETFDDYMDAYIHNCFEDVIITGD